MIIPPPRTSDAYGSGYYGAPRGDRLHTGLDMACLPGSLVCSYTHGEVTKLGYTYADDLSYRYVEVSFDGAKFRYFYIDPMVAVGDDVSTGQVLGRSQDLDRRYPGITPHFHFEIIDNDGEYANPASIIEELTYE